MITNELKIAYIHITRTVNNLHDFLGRHFTRRLRLDFPDQDNPDSAEFYARYNLIEGHFGYQVLPLPRCFKYITVLRDPVDRVVSSYSRLKSFVDNPERQIPPVRIIKENNMSFLDFVTSSDPNILYFTHAQTLWLSGLKSSVAVLDLEHEVGVAVENLKYNFDFVGIRERMDDTMIALKARYGIPGELPVYEQDCEMYKPTEKEYMIAKQVLFNEYIVYDAGCEIYDNQRT